MQAIVKEPGKPPEVRDIAPTLDAYQGIVGGDIEVVPGWTIIPGVSMYCNEEGKLDGLPLNFRTPYDHIVGTVVVVGGPDDEGEDLPLTDAQVAQLLPLLNKRLVQ